MKTRLFNVILLFSLGLIFSACSNKGNVYEIEVEMLNVENPDFQFAIQGEMGYIIYDEATGETIKKDEYAIKVEESKRRFQVKNTGYLIAIIAYKPVSAVVDPRGERTISMIIYKNGEVVYSKTQRMNQLSFNKFEYLEYSDKPKEEK